MPVSENRANATAFLVRAKALVFHLTSALAELDAMIGSGSALGEQHVPWDMGRIVGRESLMIGVAMSERLHGELTAAEGMLDRAEDYLKALGS